ncbi:MAG TPA: NUDIX domain-containing protein [Candidatus Saccharimonadales bacterium]|jgi:8-oxo-dGTP pyrophosphatase MutT (NUDIX family)|nr:NUDIX domain-containing protein [Candidatus Saccharimonadales bacterium]
MKGTTNIPVVNIILRREDGKVLFLLRQNTDWMDGFHGLPSGHVEEGENFRQAACREIKEEVGIDLEPDQLQHRLTFHQVDDRGGTRVGIYFEAAGWEGEPYNAEPDKHGDLAWFDPDNLPDSVIATTRLKLDQIKQGNPYIEYGWT